MSKMTLRKRIAVTTRGWGILKKYCPGLAQQKALQELISSLQPFVSVWLSARIVDELFTYRRMNYIVLYVFFVVLLNFICTVAKSIIQHICTEKESQMWKWFEKVFADKQMSLDFDDLEDTEIQRRRQEAEENLFMFGNGLAQLVWGITGLVRAFVNITAALLMSASLFFSKSGNKVIDHPIWIFLVLICIVLCGFSNFLAKKKEDKLFMQWCKNTMWYNHTFMFFGRELFVNQDRAKDVRIYRQDMIGEKKLDELEQWDKAQKGCYFQMAAYPALASVLIGLGNVACYLFVAVKAFFGAYGVGSVVQYVSVLSRLGEGIQEFMFLLSDNETYCTYLQKMYDYLDIPNHMYQGSLTVEKREDNEYFVEFRDVSFRYPKTEKFVLRHVNLRFKVGEKLAVVGRNGSGKTTFIKLLCRLYDPTEGEILLNGVDIRKYDYAEYMSIFSVVFQDFKLFAFSLGQNVSASMEYEKERAERCLEKAGFGTRLQEMKNGLDTYLYKNFEDDGVDISGGEAQKIALARALYKDAPFIILDEPTAALDPVAEYEVYSKFNEIVQDKTAIYISHRLSSCRFCDVIAVFDEGQIVQRGSHEELVNDVGGKYYELWKAQAQYYV